MSLSAFLQPLGGLGLFLFGMAVMTSGLKKLAGDRLHRWLAKGTRTPLSGAVTGTVITALVQSSSATTVAAIGFVSAGLLTFSQALGIIFGANIGTTLTGWIVALVGFKLKLGTAALPLLFVAALLYLNKKNRRMRGAGKALAGFSLIFLGISELQEGLGAVHGSLDLSKFSVDSISGRLVLVLVGVVFTILTQSSSATVATALTALNTGVISLPQAASVVIGADIGTTATAALATIGGTTASRRTGLAHVIYNVFTGLVAFLLLPAYLAAWKHLLPATVASSPEFVAVSFHSFFNLLGVAAILPFTETFARFIEWVVPPRGNPLAASLDPRLLGDPDAAYDALDAVAARTAHAVLDVTTADLTARETDGRRQVLDEVTAATRNARQFVIELDRRSEDNEIEPERLFAFLHMIDHIERLAQRLARVSASEVFGSAPHFAEKCAEVAPLINAASAGFIAREEIKDAGELGDAAKELDDEKSKFRSLVIERAADEGMTADELDALLDAFRSLRRTVYHSWRIAHYWNQVVRVDRAPTR